MVKEREDGSLNASMPVSFMPPINESTLVASRNHAGHGAVAVGRMVLGLIEFHGDNGIYGHAILVI